MEIIHTNGNNKPEMCCVLISFISNIVNIHMNAMLFFIL